MTDQTPDRNEVFQRQLVAVADHYSAQIRAAQAIIDDLQPKLDTLRFLDPPSMELEYRGICAQVFS